MAWKGNKSNITPGQQIWNGNSSNSAPNTIQTDVNRSEGRVQDNRALHLRRDTDKIKNFTVSIKDIDETVFKHLTKMQLTVVDNGNHISVPISYASPEKWKSVRNDGFMRDNNGRIILPALIFYRQSSEQDTAMMTFNKYLRYSVMKPYSTKNQYTKFSTLMNQNAPVREVYNLVMADHMNFNYKFVLWTEYVEQMNSIIEKLNFETNDYWGDIDGFKFRTSVSSYMHTTEVAADEDRLIRTEFDLVLRGYLLPEQFAPGLDDFKSTTEKVLTKKKILFNTEAVESDWTPKADESVNDRWRSQNFPNLTLEDELRLRNIPVSVMTSGETQQFQSEISVIVKTGGTINWTLPPPTSSSDSGIDGMQSYDSNYLYIHAGGAWKRVPLTLFGGF